MKGTRTLRTIGAVALSAAVGLGFSTSAHALKFVQSTGNNPATTDTASETVTYAKETLLKGTGNVTAASDSADKTIYYDIVRDHFVSAPPGVTASGTDTYVLSYTLEGMVFATAVAEPTNFSLASGGAAGDKSVVFRATAAIPATAIELTAQFAVSADGGSITMVVRNADLITIGVEGMKTHGPARVMVKPALKVTALPTAPAPVAKATSEFMNFGGPEASPTLRASLGTFEVGVTTPNLEDAQGATNTAEDVTTLDDVTAVDANADGSVANAVTFSVEGGFGFLKTLALADAPAADSTDGPCDGTLTEIRKAVTPATNPATYTDETTPREAQTFEHDTDADGTDDNMLQHLCIEVDGETAIPRTGPFMVMSAYKGLENAAFPPMATMSSLAAITRDGTQYNIPFLTDDMRFKQRITIQNRGRASMWSLGNLSTIAPGGVMLESGMGSGALPMGQTVIKVWEHIDVGEGGSRASGSLTIPIASTSVTASVDIVNPENGTIDTTILMAAE